MSAQTRSKSRKQVMSGDKAISDRKLDDIISKMDVLLQAKTEMLKLKLSTLELTQATLVKRVLMGVPSYQLTATFLANCQLTTNFS